MEWKDVTGALLGFIEKLLSDASLWFWLSIAAASILIADWSGAIPLNRVVSEPKFGIGVVLIVMVCLWLNALQAHLPVLRIARCTQQLLTQWWRKRRVLRLSHGAEATLIDLLQTRCLERRWLVWYLGNLETEQGPHNDLLTYENTQYDREFEGARRLLEIGLLHRTGDNPSALIFLHKQLYRRVLDAYRSNNAIREAIQEEQAVITEQGAEALRDDLPRYRTVKFMQKHAQG